MTAQMDLFSESGQGDGGFVEPVALHEAARKRYLNYALSVITSRALPDVRDGLKPVQRRILYAMYKDLKLRHDSRFLKSARVVGDVMGKYHPHGDQSIYEAMVRMAQAFSLRYPLVDGHGNFGSIDGDGAAAMRYTEARLQSLAEELLSEINAGTVDFRPNYDGQLSEPVVLPAQIPNLLINGATGIAVGMATNIPPHNLREVIDALLLLIDRPDAPIEAVLRHIKAPDFPTGGEILSTEDELKELYAKGHGAVKLRGEYITDTVNKKRSIILTSIPYATDKSKLIAKIAALIETRKVPQIIDIRDESTDDIRIVMELKRGASAEVAMAYLYKHTPLSGSFHVNLTCLAPTAEGILAPARLGIIEILKYFLDFRMEVIGRRLRNRLEKLREEIHRLRAFELIFDVLDEVIALIRASEGKSDAARKLMDRFDLDEVQTEAILELKLYRLAKLEILLIQQQLAERREEAARIESLLGDVGARWRLMADELKDLRDAYGDERRTRLVGPAVLTDFEPEAYIVRESTWVIVSRQGRVKRQKGFSEVSAIRVPEGDEVGWVIRTDTTQTIAFYTQLGSAYVLRVDDIQQTTGYGEPVQASFQFADGERIVGVSASDPKLYPVSETPAPKAPREPTLELEEGQAAPTEPAEPGEPEAPPPHGIALTRDAKVVRFPLAAFKDVTTRAGRRFISLASDDEVLSVQTSLGDENLAVATKGGRVLLFAVGEIPVRTNAVKGANAIKLESGDAVLGYGLTRKKREGLTVFTSRGREIVIRETSYPAAARGGKGYQVVRQGGLVRCEAQGALVLAPDELNEAPEAPAGDEA